MSTLPTGTVTFLFTDIEGSTQLLQQLGDTRYSQALADYRRLLRAAFNAAGGHELETQGDGLLVAFASARDGVQMAVAAQQAIVGHRWPEGVTLRVRMGLHTGEPVTGEAGYVGIDIHRAARICAAGSGGQVLISQTTRDLVADDLPADISLLDLGAHRLKDLTNPQHLFQVVATDLLADFPPLKSLDALPNNLPVQLTSFIGREREKAELRRLLSTTRLLTLTGAGGAGKTRLALQVAADRLDDFKDGVWLAELAPLSDAELIPRAVASVLNVREQPGQPILSTLTNSLKHKQLPCVLDNCEHLVAACARLADSLLRACPSLRILATSRERLGVAGEISWRVPSLSLPDFRRCQPAARLTEYEAPMLFAERATAVLPTFTVTDETAALVTEICSRLDGIPLAIELAAARVRVLSLDQITARLSDRFRLLTGGDRAALPRHQTLRATMDWSYDLLSGKERTLLRRLSVFAGGFTLEAAEGICAGEVLEPNEVLDLLTGLVDKSLVVLDAHEQQRAQYRLLETVRQYSQDRLLESGDAEATQRRHLDWYLALAERAEPELQGPDQVPWLKRLDSAHDNLRAALGWSLTADAEAVLRLAGGMFWFWYIRGHWSEGIEWLEAALSRRDDASPKAVAKGLYYAGNMAWLKGDNARAATLCGESLALCRNSGDKRGIAHSLLILGNVALSQGDYPNAEALHDECLSETREAGDRWTMAAALGNKGLHESRKGNTRRAIKLMMETLALFRALGDKDGVGLTLINLGWTMFSHGDVHQAIAMLEEGLELSRTLGIKRNTAFGLLTLGTVVRLRGDVERAATLLEACVELNRELESKGGIAWSLHNLGILAWQQGDYERSRALLEESLALYRESRSRPGIALSLGSLGMLAGYQAHFERARTLLEESQTIYRELDSKPGIAQSLASLGFLARRQGDYERAATVLKQSLVLHLERESRLGVAGLLENLAAIAQAEGQPERSARLFGAADALRDALGTPLPPPDRSEYGQQVSQLRQLMEEKVFASAWESGRTMTCEQAVAYVLEEDGQQYPARPSGSTLTYARNGTLSNSDPRILAGSAPSHLSSTVA